jgi:hypothetical protein
MYCKIEKDHVSKYQTDSTDSANLEKVLGLRLKWHIHAHENNLMKFLKVVILESREIGLLCY